MSRLVKFTEMVGGSDRYQRKAEDQGKADTYLVDSEQVAMVMPRSTYTTLLVQGKWIHVAHTLDDVLSKLGWEAE